MPVVWSDDHRLHEPGGEVWLGVRTPGTELPERAERIRAALTDAGAPLVDASHQPDEAVASVHDSGLTHYLSSAWPAWRRPGSTRSRATTASCRTCSRTRTCSPGARRARPPRSRPARGQFAYDTMTLIGPGTWEAARAAVDAAVTAAQLVLDGAPAAYACTRPPGHHATRSRFGGSCYLNNTAAAAARLRDGRHERVAVIDIDAHHGNGTQAIFWDDADVLTASVHVDPGAGWFPHFLGFEDERGVDQSNRNRVVPPGTGDDLWVEAVDEIADWVADNAASALVVALGVDAAAGDPESPLAVTSAGFRRRGTYSAASGSRPSSCRRAATTWIR